MLTLKRMLSPRASARASRAISVLSPRICLYMQLPHISC